MATRTQRNVNGKLGCNTTSVQEMFYEAIQNAIGPTKICNFGHERGSKTGVKHEGIRVLPIRNFPQKGCSIDENGRVVITDGDGLQGFCRDCDNRRRRVRLDTCRENNEGGYETYEERYGTTKRCSVCKEDKVAREHFNLSPGMECGLHNVCKSCSKKYGESVGDRIINYRPDGNYKYSKSDDESDQHDDHIMPLAYGGSNEEVNHQLLPGPENLSKSDTIPYDNVKDIPRELLSERWRPILDDAQQKNHSIQTFKSKIKAAMEKENKELYDKTDQEIISVFEKYRRDNNRRTSLDRCVSKFRKYCEQMYRITPASYS